MYIHRNWNSMQASARHYLNDIDLLWFSLTCLHQFSTIFWKWCRYELFVSPRVLLHQGCESKQQLVPVNSPACWLLPHLPPPLGRTLHLPPRPHGQYSRVMTSSSHSLTAALEGRWPHVAMTKYFICCHAPPPPSLFSIKCSVKNQWIVSSLPPQRLLFTAPIHSLSRSSLALGVHSTYLQFVFI